jgi:hypothetical protein
MVRASMTALQSLMDDCKLAKIQKSRKSSSDR